MLIYFITLIDLLLFKFLKKLINQLNYNQNQFYLFLAFSANNNPISDIRALIDLFNLTYNSIAFKPPF